MTACQEAAVSGCTEQAVVVHVTGCTYAEHISRFPWCHGHSTWMTVLTEGSYVDCVQCHHILGRFSRVRLLKIEPISVPESGTSA